MAELVDYLKIHVSDEVLRHISKKLESTSLPPDQDNDDWSYGTNRQYLDQLLAYWRDDYDWRAVEQEMNGFPNYVTEIDGTRIHFLIEMSTNPAAIPLIITHGWPWSYWDMKKVIRPLAHPHYFGGDLRDAFHVVVPSLPGYGFSGPPKTRGVNFWQTADLWHRLMTDVLGFKKYAASGGDWGALVSSQIGHKYADDVYGVHLMHAMLLDQFNTERPWDALGRALDTHQKVPEQMKKFVSHYAVQVMDPQTLAYALQDSPAGLLAWMLERWRAWGDSRGDPGNVYSKEHMITTAMLYFATGTVSSSMRAYADAARFPWEPSHAAIPVVQAPVGITFLGGENPPGVTTEQRIEIFKNGARARFFNVQFASAHEHGGHFGYYENPKAVISDLRAFFRNYRT